MSCKRFSWLLPIVPLVFFAACRREQARSGVDRIAILRFENLGPNPADDWIGRAFSETISAELEGAAGERAIPSARLHAIDASYGARPPQAPGISAERGAALVAGATKLGYGQYIVRNGILHAALTVEDVGTGRMASLNSVVVPIAGIEEAATALAAQISPRIHNYGTRNWEVIRAHARALEGLTAPGVADDLAAAIAADPNFGPSYRQLAQLKVQQNDIPGALALLNQALARGNALGEAERARIALQSAVLRNDPDARLQALTALAKADPGDAQTWRDLAVNAMATHQYPQAVEAYRKLLEIQPGDPDALNQLGYAAAYAGDASAATSAIGEYQKLQPASPNPLDSLGDVHFILGHLAEAETTYLQATKKDPNFYAGLDFLKAALAHLMTGDVPGADRLAQQYFDARAAAKDPLLEYRKAQWDWISGRRKAALQKLEAVGRDASAGNRELAALSYSELAIWNLMLGSRDAASQAAQKAMAMATPSTATAVILARFLSQPAASASEWQARANQLAPNPAQAPIRNLATAYALLFAKEFGPAAAVLQSMYDHGTGVADEGLPVLLAWADLESGRAQAAGVLLRSNPPLSNAGLSWSTALYFPRILYLRGLAAQKQGKQDEADFRIFRELSGSDPLMWGEEQKSR